MKTYMTMFALAAIFLALSALIGSRDRKDREEKERRHLKEGFGKKGDLVALEVNMRPSGGFSPDMVNFAHSTNVYKIWADMIAFDRSTKEVGSPQFCAYLGLRDGYDYVLSRDEVLEKYKDHMKMHGRIPDVLADAMGNQFYIATFETEEKMKEFYESVQLRRP